MRGKQNRQTAKASIEMQRHRIEREFNAGAASPGDLDYMTLPKIIVHHLQHGDSLLDFAGMWGVDVASVAQFIRRYRMVQECADAVGVAYTTIRSRMVRGMTLATALRPAMARNLRARYAAHCRFYGRKVARERVLNHPTLRTRLRQRQDRHPGLGRYNV